jgi:hypothetical protein
MSDFSTNGNGPSKEHESVAQAILRTKMFGGLFTPKYECYCPNCEARARWAEHELDPACLGEAPCEPRQMIGALLNPYAATRRPADGSFGIKSADPDEMSPTEFDRAIPIRGQLQGAATQRLPWLGHLGFRPSRLPERAREPAEHRAQLDPVLRRPRAFRARVQRHAHRRRSQPPSRGTSDGSAKPLPLSEQVSATQASPPPNRTK